MTGTPLRHHLVKREVITEEDDQQEDADDLLSKLSSGKLQPHIICIIIIMLLVFILIHWKLKYIILIIVAGLISLNKPPIKDNWNAENGSGKVGTEFDSPTEQNLNRILVMIKDLKAKNEEAQISSQA